MTLGKRIKDYRQKLGLSQEKIAELVGTSRQAVTKWETDQTIPCMENLIKLAEIFGISLNELSSGVNNDIPIENTVEVNSQNKPQKSLLMLDIVFVLVALFATWNILKIPAYIGYSMVGFFTIVIQAAAILYIPLYLFLIRPRRVMLINGRQYGNDMKFGGKVPIKERILWSAGAIFVLYGIHHISLWYLLSDNAIILGVHWLFNSDQPLVSLIFGLIIIIMATIKFSKKVMISVIIGYASGITLAALFNVDSPDPNGAMVYNNAWAIWTVTHLIFVMAGIACEIIGRYLKRKKN